MKKQFIEEQKLLEEAFKLAVTIYDSGFRRLYCGHLARRINIGWHNLSEEEYQQKLKEHQEKEAENNNDANE